MIWIPGVAAQSHRDDPRFGGSWNEVGEAMLNRGDAKFSIEWFRGLSIQKIR